MRYRLARSYCPGWLWTVTPRRLRDKIASWGYS